MLGLKDSFVILGLGLGLEATVLGLEAKSLGLALIPVYFEIILSIQYSIKIYNTHNVCQLAESEVQI